ncbi:LysR family transcriptional regulator [Lachnospiraceae bacterium ZAX-1]
MDISLDYYKVFYYVGKMQSISLAALELSISQPAVSQAMKNLENSIGCRLFVRTARGVRFTVEGEALFSYIKRGYEFICQGEKKVYEMLHLEDGEIRIGASDMTLQFYLLSHLERFHEKYPAIKVTVTNAPTPETLHYLLKGVIDFGVVSSPIVSRHNWEITQVRQIEDVFVAGKNFWHLKGAQLAYKQLERLPVICLEGNTSTRSYVEAFLKEQGVVLYPEFELATSNMLVQFAVRGFGIAEVVKDFARESIEREELFILNFDRSIPPRQFCIVTDDRIPISAAADKLLSMLKEP